MALRTDATLVLFVANGANGDTYRDTTGILYKMTIPAGASNKLIDKVVETSVAPKQGSGPVTVAVDGTISVDALSTSAANTAIAGAAAVGAAAQSTANNAVSAAATAQSTASGAAAAAAAAQTTANAKANTADVYDKTAVDGKFATVSGQLQTIANLDAQQTAAITAAANALANDETLLSTKADASVVAANKTAAELAAAQAAALATTERTRALAEEASIKASILAIPRGPMLFYGSPNPTVPSGFTAQINDTWWDGSAKRTMIDTNTWLS
jgi:hypothetical protein